jgi:hypothetical protein
MAPAAFAPVAGFGTCIARISGAHAPAAAGRTASNAAQDWRTIFSKAFGMTDTYASRVPLRERDRRAEPKVGRPESDRSAGGCHASGAPETARDSSLRENATRG